MSVSNHGRDEDSRVKPATEPTVDPLSSLDDLKQGLNRKRASEHEPSDESIREVEEKYEAILEVSKSLNSTLELDELLSNIVDGIVRITGCERGFLMLREPDGEFSTHIGRTKDRKEWHEADSISSTIVRRVVETGQPFISPDLAQVDNLKNSGSILEHSIRSAVCLPLNYSDRLIGVIYADSGFVVEQVLDADHTILDALTAQAALAIENARRHGEIKSRRDRLEEQNQQLRKRLVDDFSYSGMISKNKRMLEVFDAVERIALHDIPVMISGESGTGKEVLARAIHEKSPRSSGHFETVNCAAIPQGLVESILFGHKQGAFTGAIADKPGVFELAHGGTLFLDEIGDMPLEVQPKILHAVQSGEIRRLGEEDRVRKVDTRIICATHVDLARAVEEGKFRQDLYYRLNVARVGLPPLRERREDIVPLAEYFLKRYAEEKKQPVARLARDAQEFLVSNPWVGNVRELKGVVEWGIIFQDDDHMIHAKELEKYFKQQSAFGAEEEPVGTSLKAQIQKYEEEVIRKTLREHGFNVTSSARTLEISRQQLHNKIRKFGISTKHE